eukprot:IDg11789t1
MNNEAQIESAATASKSRKVRFIIDDGDAGEFAPDPSFAVHYPADARKLSVLQNNPLVPIGAGITAAVLLGGLFAFNRGSVLWSQRMMRARLLAQGATVALFARSVHSVYAEKEKHRSPGVRTALENAPPPT